MTKISVLKYDLFYRLPGVKNETGWVKGGICTMGETLLRKNDTILLRNRHLCYSNIHDFKKTNAESTTIKRNIYIKGNCYSNNQTTSVIGKQLW